MANPTHLGQLGTTYYIGYDDGTTVCIEYEVYQALSDMMNDVITPEEVEAQVKHYKEQRELVQCPLCETGRVRRDMASPSYRPYLEDMHERLVH